MLKFNRVVCLLLVCACVGVVYAKATKIFMFTNVNAGVTENPDGDGVVMFNVDALGDTHVQVSMSGFLPDSDYFVAVVPGIRAAAVTTNAAGNLHFQGVIRFDVILDFTNPCVIIWIDDNRSDEDLIPNRDLFEDDDGNVIGIFGPEDRSRGCVE